MESDGPEIGALNELDLQPPESKSSKSSAFHVTLTQIQGKPLNPDNINTYASDALADLIKLTDSIVGDYAREQPSDSAYGKELEDKAFEHFGLGNLGDILNYVASKELELGKIDELIEKVENTNTVIVPPNGEMQLIQENDGSFGKKSVISRTKTLLFILSNDFDVDINDPQQVSLKTGALSDNMMRKLSYFLINVPKLKRTILSCDEEGNVTYIFDNDILNAKGISLENLASLTKENIKELLQANPNLGRRIIYTNNFVPRIINLMTDLDNNNDASNGGAGLYLYPKAPEGVLSTRGFAEELKLGNRVVGKVIKQLGESLGEVRRYKFFNQITEGYTPKQQEMIKQALRERGLFINQASEGVLSTRGIAEELKVGDKIVKKVIKQLGESLGEVQKYRFGSSQITHGYTPEQQKIIRQRLTELGRFLQQAPEGILSTPQIANKLGVSFLTVAKAIEELGGELGDVQQYRFQNAVARGYTIGQKEMIEQRLKEKGLLDLIPEGILSINGLAIELKVGRSVIEKVIKQLKDNLGEVRRYKFFNKVADGYTTEQKEIIRQELERRRGARGSP